MTGPKLNEKSFVAGERSGTKATARYVRPSAFKARVVLDLIRGLDVKTADEVLQFTDRDIARDIRKVLASAVANAVQQRRARTPTSSTSWRASPTRARRSSGSAPGPVAVRRASTSAAVTSRSSSLASSDERIAVIQARQERAGGSAGRGRPQSSAASRRARVERSRQQAARPTRPKTSSTPRSSTRRRRGHDSTTDGRRAVDSATAESAEALEADATEDDATADADVIETEEVTESDDADDVKERDRQRERQPPREAPATRRSPPRRTDGPTRRARSNGSEDQSVRLPPGSDHRLEVRAGSPSVSTRSTSPRTGRSVARS